MPGWSRVKRRRHLNRSRPGVFGWFIRSVESFSTFRFCRSIYSVSLTNLCDRFPSLLLFAAAAQHLHHNADRAKPPKRGFLQSIFCCWRKARTKTTQNGTPIDGTITPPPSSQKYLLPPVRHSDMHKKCMVIDLDETLVHSSFKVSFSLCGELYTRTFFASV